MIRDIYNMRHFRFSTWKLLAGLLLAGCTASDETLLPGTGNEGGEENLVRICAIGGMPEGGPETRLVYEEDETQAPVGLNITWKDPSNGEREQFVATQGTDLQTPYLFTLHTLESDAHNASFETAVSPDALKEGNTFYAFYPVPAETELCAMSFPLDLTEQTGKLDDLPTYMYAPAKYTEAGADEQKLNFEFKHLTAVVRLTLRFENDYLTEIKDVRFTANDLHRKATVNVTQGNVTYAYDPSETEVINSGDGILRPQKNEDDKMEIVVYFCLLPGTYEDVSVATFNSAYEQRFYSTTNLATKTLQAGMMYSATINMTEDTYNITFQDPNTVGGGTLQYAGAEVTMTSKDKPEDGSIRGTIETNGTWRFDADNPTNKAMLNKIFREGNTVVITIAGATLTRASASYEHVVTAEEVANHTLTLPDLNKGDIEITYPDHLLIIGGSTWAGSALEKASPLVKYDSTKPWLYTYIGWIDVAEEGFKFLTETKWAGSDNNIVEYRCATNIDSAGKGKLRVNGADDKFKLPANYTSGNYRITCDLQEMTVQVEMIGYQEAHLKHTVLYLVGDATPGDWTVKYATPIYANQENPYLLEGVVYLTAGEFKICINPYCDDANSSIGSWNQYFYYNAGDGTMSDDGTGDRKWTITESGYYKFTIDMRDLSIQYVKQE